MQRFDDWSADGLDTDRPSVARMYDYYLGGRHNFPVDRALAEQVISTYPDLPLVLRHGRLFLGRVVRELCRLGIRQFIDLGSGLPTVGNVHEIAQEEAPGARVVYVDIDQVAVTYSRMMLIGNNNASVVHGDVRHIELILGHRDLLHLIDFKQPVAVMAFAMLQFVPDADDPRGIIRTIFDTVAPGSYFAMSHAGEDIAPEETERVRQLYARSANPLIFRNHPQLLDMYDRFELVEPGLVPVDQWRPAAEGTMGPAMSGYGGVGYKA